MKESIVIESTKQNESDSSYATAVGCRQGDANLEIKTKQKREREKTKQKENKNGKERKRIALRPTDHFRSFAGLKFQKMNQGFTLFLLFLAKIGKKFNFLNV